MFAIGLVVVGLLVVGLLLAASTRPDDFVIQRSAQVQGTPEQVVALIEDFHQWGTWSPWEKLDPAMKRTFSGPSSGKGAAYTWEGTKAGSGRMEVLETSASLVKIQLDFVKPFAAKNVAEFTLTPRADGVELVWAMKGKSPLMSKVMGMFVDMDKLIGKDFEAGLATLKATIEAARRAA
jgi:hypothetical protein